MTTILVWLLLVVSDGPYNRGTASVLEKFPTAEQCEHVRRYIPTTVVESHCVQANILVPK